MLHFGIFPQATVADVFIICLGGFNTAWLRPCIADIADTGVLVYDSARTEPYVRMFTEANRVRWRNINWPNNIPALEEFLTAESRHVWLATVYEKQAAILKEHFGERIKTVAMNYTEEMYPVVLENWARFNATLYLNGDIQQRGAMIDSQFINLPSNLPDNFLELAEYFRANVELFRDGLPQEITNHADYVIDLKDLYTESVFFNHLAQLGTLPTPKSVIYYNKWLTGQLEIDVIKHALNK